MEAAHLPGGGGVLRAAAARAAPAPARPRAARAHHIGSSRADRRDLIEEHSARTIPSAVYSVPAILSARRADTSADTQ